MTQLSSGGRRGVTPPVVMANSSSDESSSHTSSSGAGAGMSSSTPHSMSRRAQGGADPSQLPNEEAGKFEKMRVLGRGAFGAVTLVKDTTDSRLYAMKTLNWSEKEELRKAAMVEVHLLRTLKHPFVVNLYEAFISTDGRLVCLTMTYCESGDLSKVITHAAKTKAYLPEKQVLSWFTQTCLAILYLQTEWSMLHRDIKPNNIFLLDSKKYVKVGDFGLARTIQTDSEEIVKAEVGTPYYTSPEMCNSKPYGFPSDVWSLGVVLHEMLALVVPFHSHDVIELVQQVIGSKPPDIPKHYSPEVGRLVKWLLQKDPALRPTLSQVLSCSLLKRHLGPLVKFYKPINLPERRRRSELRDLELQAAYINSFEGDSEIPRNVEEGSGAENSSTTGRSNGESSNICEKCAASNGICEGKPCSHCDHIDTNGNYAASAEPISPTSDVDESPGESKKITMSWANSAQAAFATDSEEEEEEEGETEGNEEDWRHEVDGEDEYGSASCSSEIRTDEVVAVTVSDSREEDQDAAGDHDKECAGSCDVGVPLQVRDASAIIHLPEIVAGPGPQSPCAAQPIKEILVRKSPTPTPRSESGDNQEPDEVPVTRENIGLDGGPNSTCNEICGNGSKTMIEQQSSGVADSRQGESLSREVLDAGKVDEPLSPIPSVVQGEALMDANSSKGGSKRRSLRVARPLQRRSTSKSLSPPRRRRSAEASPTRRKSNTKSPKRQKSFAGSMGSLRRGSVSTLSSKGSDKALSANPPPRRSIKTSKSPIRLKPKRRSSRGGLTVDSDMVAESPTASGRGSSGDLLGETQETLGSAAILECLMTPPSASASTIAIASTNVMTPRSIQLDSAALSQTPPPGSDGGQQRGMLTPRSAADLKITQRLSEALTFAQEEGSDTAGGAQDRAKVQVGGRSEGDAAKVAIV